MTMCQRRHAATHLGEPRCGESSGRVMRYSCGIEIFARQVKPPAIRVLPQVSQDISQLQRPPQRVRHLIRGW